MTIHLHQGDLPDGLDFGAAVAVDSETMGLDARRDRLCLVQLSAGDGVCHLVQFANGVYDAPRLSALMTDAAVTKLFHFARFDLMMLKRHLGIDVTPLFCTKIASKLVRTSTDRHGLKDLCRDLRGVELQSPDPWFSLAAAGAMFGLSPTTLRHQIERGALHGVKAGRNWLVHRDDLHDYVEKRSRKAKLPAAARNPATA